MINLSQLKPSEILLCTFTGIIWSNNDLLKMNNYVFYTVIYICN